MLRSPPNGLPEAGGGGTPGGVSWRMLGRGQNSASDSGQGLNEAEMEMVWKGNTSEVDREVCGCCQDRVSTGQMGLECEICKFWFHAKCEKLTKREYDKISDVIEKVSWHCKECKSFAGKIVEENRKLYKELGELKHNMEEMKKGMKAAFDIQQSVKKTEVELKNLVKNFSEELEEIKKNQEKVNESTKKLDQAVNKKLESMGRQIQTYSVDILKETNMKIEKTMSKIQQDEAAEKDDKRETINHLKQEFENVKKGIEKGSMSSEVRTMHERVERIERDSKKKNLIIFNLSESKKDVPRDRFEEDKDACLELVTAIGVEDVKFGNLIRLGRKTADKVRPLLVKFEEEKHIKAILLGKNSLRGTEKFCQVYVDKDMSKEERENMKKLREELYAKRELGNAHYVISRGRVVERTGPAAVRGEVGRGGRQYPRGRGTLRSGRNSEVEGGNAGNSVQSTHMERRNNMEAAGGR